MAKQGYGKIINIASIAGMIGRDRKMYQRSDMNEQPVDYAAAKAGIIGMTRELAGYLSPMSINVNCVSYICDRVLIIDRGQIVALDTPEALIRSLGTEKRLVFTLPEDLRGVYRAFGIDLPLLNGDDSWTLPLPARG